MTEEDLRQRIAYHEAGHAVLSWTYGLNFEKVHILSDKECSGKVSLGDWPDWDRDFVLATAKTLLAGEAATEILTGVPVDWDEHFDVRGSDIDVFIHRVLSLGWYENDADGFMDYSAALTQCFSEVRSLLEERWPAVEALACALLDRGALSGEEAVDLMASAPGPGPVARLSADFEEEQEEEKRRFG